MFEALKKYAVFSGRARRKEYWLFVLLFVIVLILARAIGAGIDATIDATIDAFEPRSGARFLSFLVILGFLIPGIAVTVRRLHDINTTGWWALFLILPIGGIALFIPMCLDGTQGENRFGPDPKASEPPH